MGTVTLEVVNTVTEEFEHPLVTVLEYAKEDFDHVTIIVRTETHIARDQDDNDTLTIVGEASYLRIIGDWTTEELPTLYAKVKEYQNMFPDVVVRVDAYSTPWQTADGVWELDWTVFVEVPLVN